MNDDAATVTDAAGAVLVPAPPPAAPAGRAQPGLIALAVVVALIAVVALVFAWRAEQRVRSTERELVKRQQDAGERVAEAMLLAKQAQDGLREATAKVALLEQRLNEISVQRVQLEDLMQQLARSRDEFLLTDVESALRAGAQQAALTGSVEPLVATLRSADERLARAGEPRLEPVRRAIARDLERAVAASVADAATLSARIDEAVRLLDDAPLVASADVRRGQLREWRDTADPELRGEPAPPPGGAASSATESVGSWLSRNLGRAARAAFDGIWADVRSLVRVTRIERPEAMLVSPEQGWFLRENLKLRLLNARLSVLSRHFDAAEADLRAAQAAIERYFDPQSRRTRSLLETLRSVAQLARQTGVPRPDDTYAALQAAGGTR